MMVNRQKWYSKMMQLGHAENTFRACVVGWEAEEGCASNEEGVGCARVKWKLCGGNLRRLGLGAVHSHACIIYPFPLASMHPLSFELPHHIAPCCSHSSISKTRKLHETFQHGDIVQCYPIQSSEVQPNFDFLFNILSLPSTHLIPFGYICLFHSAVYVYF